MSADGINSTNINSFVESPLIKAKEQEKTDSAKSIDIYSANVEKELTEIASKNPQLFNQISESPDLCMDKLTAFSDIPIDNNDKLGVVGKLASRVREIKAQFMQPATSANTTDKATELPQIQIPSSELANELNADDISTAMSFVSANGEAINSGKYKDSADFKNLPQQIQNYITAKFAEASAKAEN